MGKKTIKSLIAVILCAMLLLSLSVENVPNWSNAEEYGTGTQIATETDAVRQISNEARPIAREDTDIRELPNPNVQFNVYIEEDGQYKNLFDADGNQVQDVKDGDKVRMNMDWVFKDANSQPIDENTLFRYQLDDSTREVLKQLTREGKVLSGAKEVGTFSITDDGWIEISITDEDFIKENQNSVKGSIVVDATLEMSDDAEVDENGKSKVVIEGQDLTVQTVDPSGTPGVEKTAGSLYTAKDGKTYCDFEVEITNKLASELEIKDNLEENAAFKYDQSSFVLVGPNGTEQKLSGSDIDFSDNGFTYTADVEVGKTYTLKYRVEVEDSFWSENASEQWGEGKNIVTVTDTTNEKSRTDDAYVVNSYKQLEKSGTVSNDGTIIWTVTVNQTNPENKMDISGNTYKDTLPEGMKLKEGSQVTVRKANDWSGQYESIPADDFFKNGYTFPENSIGTYEITYETVLDDSVNLGFGGETFSNTVEIVDKDIETTADVTIKDNWAEKKVVTDQVDEENKTITWEVSITIPAGAKTSSDFVYTDTVGEDHKLVEDSIQVTYPDELQISDKDTRLSNKSDNGFELNLSDIENKTDQDLTITVTYQTSYEEFLWGTNEASKTFINTGVLKDNTTHKEETVEAEYVIYNDSILILNSKWEDSSASAYTKVEWTISLQNLQQLKGRLDHTSNPEEKVYIYDTPQFYMEVPNSEQPWVMDRVPLTWAGYVTSNARITEAWSDTVIFDDIPCDIMDDGTIRFDITSLFQGNHLMNQYGGKIDTAALKYTLDLDADTINQMMKDNLDSIKESNYAEGKLEENSKPGTLLGKVGGETTVAEHKLGEVLTKKYTYSEDTAPYAKYTITVNPNGYKLLEEGMSKLRLVDTWGTDLEINPKSIKLTDLAGNPIEGLDLSIDGNTLTIDNFPDKTPVILTYDLYVDIDPGKHEGDREFTENDDVGNDCKIYADSQEKLESGTQLTGNVHRARANVTGETAVITIHKYHGMSSLENAKFKLTAYEYNSSSGKFELDENYNTEQGIDVTQGNNTTGLTPAGTDTYGSGYIITDGIGEARVRLKYDRIYKVEETNAPPGYQLDTTPKYILIQGNSYDDIKEAVAAFEKENQVAITNRWLTETTLPINNEPVEGKDITISAAKSLYDADGKLTNLSANLFTFIMQRVDLVNEETGETKSVVGGVNEKVKNNADGTAAFETLSFDGNDIGKTYYYKVSEQANQDYLCDQSFYIIKVEVGIDGQSNVTTDVTTIKYQPSGNIYIKVDGSFDYTALPFTNKKFAEGTEISIPIVKQLENANIKDYADQFTFSIVGYDQSGKNVYNAEVTNDVEGNADFSLKYATADIGKTYTYEITEKIGSIQFIKYSELKYFVVVRVGYDYIKNEYALDVQYYTADEDGKMGDSIEQDEIVFVNVDTSGKLVLKKHIKGDVTKEEAEGTLTFTVTDEAGNTDTYTLKDFDYDEVTDEYTLELDAGAGSYTVEETVTDIDGYVLDSVTYSVDGSEAADGSSADVSVEAGETTTVVFEDSYSEEDTSGKLVLKKHIKGDVTKEEAEGTLTFTVTDEAGNTDTYTLKDFDYDGVTDEYTLELDAGAGSYTVEETVTDINGYVLESVTYSVDGSEAANGSSADVSVEAGETTTVVFEDSYSKEDTSGKLVLKKHIKGDVTKEEAEGTLTFTVTDEAGNTDTYTLKDFDYDGVTDEYTLELDAGAGSYTVEETVTDINGYVLESVTYSVDGSEAANGSSADVSVEAGETTTVVFEDSYSKEDTSGKLVLKKHIKGDVTKEEAEGTLTFTVTDEAGNTNTYILEQFKHDETTGEYTLELDAGAGSYTVEETVTDIDGYVLDSVTYSVDGSEAADGSSADVSVEAGETTIVVFEDTYSEEQVPEEPTTGELIVTPSTGETTDTTETTTETTTEETTTEETDTDTHSAKTGDTAPLTLVSVMMLLSLAGCAAVVIKRKRR